MNRFRRTSMLAIVFGALGLFCITSPIYGQDNSGSKAKTPSQAVQENWDDIGRRLLDMAKDWPDAKYTYRLTPQQRTFQQVLLHIAGSNYDLLNRATGRQLGDSSNDPSVDKYKTKELTIAYLKKSIEDGDAEIQREGDSGVLQRLSDWIGYTEHMGEHYGLLVAYYRASGEVPPESRPKK